MEDVPNKAYRLFHNYKITYLWLCECLPLDFIQKIPLKKNKKNLSFFTGLTSIKSK